MSYLLPILLALWGGAAPAPPPVVDEYPAAARRVTFATLEGLGPHRLDARITRTTQVEGAPPTEEDEAISLRWQDADHWQVTRRRGGKPVTEVRAWEGRAWLYTRGGAPVLHADAEPFRAALAAEWDPWTTALGAYADHLGLREVSQELVEGRMAHVYALELLDGEAGKGREVERVEGRVWIDELTAVRLVGDLQVDARHRGRVRSVRLRFAVVEIGGDPGVEPPPGIVDSEGKSP